LTGTFLKNPYFRRLAEDMTRPVALLTSIVFALAFSIRFYRAHSLFNFLLAFRFWAMSGFLSNRLPADQSVMLHQRLFAYFSKCIPFFYHASSPAASGLIRAIAGPLALAGSLLSTWALFDLGRRFGVAPARRGDICRTGAYRWLRHPIYLGYAMVELSGTLLNHLNLPIFLVSMGTLALRAHMENRVLAPNA